MTSENFWFAPELKTEDQRAVQCFYAVIYAVCIALAAVWYASLGVRYPLVITPPLVGVGAFAIALFVTEQYDRACGVALGSASIALAAIASWAAYARIGLVACGVVALYRLFSSPKYWTQVDTQNESPGE